MRTIVLRLTGLWLLGVAALHAQPGEARFSATLSAEDRAAAGYAKLSSDEVAVIDALFRRDTAGRVAASRSKEDESAETTFSQRLNAEERRAAGLAKLSATELPKLDAFIARQQSARLARSLLAPPSFVTRPSRVIPTEAKKERQIHGSFSLSYGVGSGGYSEKSGSMVLTLDDPERGFSISVGYSETHTKGGYIYRDPFQRDPFYDPLRGGPLESAMPFRP